MPITVQGYTGLTQSVGVVLEPTANPQGEQLLMPLTAGAGTMSLTTQPSALSPTTGMHLHFFILGNSAAGNIVIAGKDATPAQNTQNSITYHVPIAPQNSQGYTEFTTKETWLSVNASGITLTTLTPCTVMVWGTYGAKFLVPITADAEEKTPKHVPVDKRGINFKNLRVVQLTKGAAVDKLDCDVYTDQLWIPYGLIGNTPVITTIPAAPTSLMTSTAIANPMTLTTSLATVPPGEFLIFAITTNTAAGTIVLSGLDNYGNAQSETINFTSAATQTVYSTKRYSALTSPGANQFATTGGTSAHIAVTGVFAWVYTFTYDGINNIQPYTEALRLFNGVFGVLLPGTVLSEGTFDWQKEKEILFTGKGEAQDFLVVGDPTSTSVGTNPFSSLAQPNTIPVISWPATFFIDNDLGGSPLTTQDGSLLTFKAMISTGRKWVFVGDGMQRANFVTYATEHDFSADATIVLQNYQNYINYFKPNVPLIFGASFQGNLLGSIGANVYYETIQFTFPCKIDTFKPDFAKNPVEGILKLMSSYDFANLGYAYKVAWTAQVPPTYQN